MLAAIVRQLIAAGVPQHVRVHAERQPWRLCRSVQPSARTTWSVRASFGTRPAATSLAFVLAIGCRTLPATSIWISTPQSAPCGRSDGQYLITIFGPFSCPNWFAAR